MKRLAQLFIRRHSPHPDDASVVQVKNLTVRYDSGIALKDISFSLESGAQVAVVGPNGAGKSTLFEAIAGLLKPSSGEVHVYGGTPSGHVCIGYVPQRNRVDWGFPLSVNDVVMMGRYGRLGAFRRPGALDRKIVQKALALVNMEDLGKRNINQLSGGQQQRMFIARSLAQEAEVILMDEPLTGLDQAAQNDIFLILDKLKEQNVTVMVSLHDLNTASSYFQSIMLLNTNLMGFGPPAEVLTHQNLTRAYHGHLHLVETESGAMVVSDTHCDHGEHHV